MPVRSGAQRASHPDRGSKFGRLLGPALVAVLCALAVQLTPGSLVIRPARADTPAVPKAVFIVGPTGSLTNSDLTDAGKMADQAEAAGMEVHRVFFPHATWDNVLANIQNANLVVYMGHGYGWPSPYTNTLTESRQDGMGLNSFDGSDTNQYTYYGAEKLKESIKLAPNAIVYLNHLCYSAGNGEPGMSIPDVDLARERVDNFASGWLSIGARAVFAYGWWQHLNYPQALMTSDETMDQLFMTPAGGASKGSPSGFTGWNEARFDSERTLGATIHLDPHNKYGYYRAVTGDLSMTAADFRSTATGSLSGGGGNSNDPPEITSLIAGDGGPSGAGAATGEPVSFHPNGDGIDDTLVLSHTVTRAAYLDATVTNSGGQTVRTYSIWSAQGTTTSEWNGKSDAGTMVPDGVYTLTYVPRDSAGETGTPVSLQALVLTAIKLGKPSTLAFFARDADILSRTVKLAVTVSEPAQVSWQIVDSAGNVVRTVRAAAQAAAGKLTFTWDGRTDSGDWAPDGWYDSVVTATTSLGTYSQSREVYAGAFRATPSIDSPARASNLTLTITSTEPISGPLVVHVTQPGLATWDATATHVSGKKYSVTLGLKSDGDAGTLELVIAGTDKYGGSQSSTLDLPLR